MHVIVRYDGTEYMLPAPGNLPYVEDAIAAANAGENGGWATFPALRDGQLITLKARAGECIALEVVQE